MRSDSLIPRVLLSILVLPLGGAVSIFLIFAFLGGPHSAGLFPNLTDGSELSPVGKAIAWLIVLAPSATALYWVWRRPRGRHDAPQ